MDAQRHKVEITISDDNVWIRYSTESQKLDRNNRIFTISELWKAVRMSDTHLQGVPKKMMAESLVRAIQDELSAMLPFPAE